MMMYGYRYPFWGFGMFMGTLFCILLVIGIIYMLVRAFRNDRGDNRAIDILDEKLASGEISEEEYLKRKKLLKQR